MQKEKTVYNRNLLNESANDPNRFWSTQKRIFSSKETASISMTFAESLQITYKTIATSFCSFFTNIASTLKLNAASLKNIVCSNPKQNYPKNYLTFRFKDVQEKEVPKYWKNCPVKKPLVQTSYYQLYFPSFFFLFDKFLQVSQLSTVILISWFCFCFVR